MKLRTMMCFSAMVALAGASGCGDGGKPAATLVKAKGVVNYNGKPISGATVTFTYDKPGPICNGFTDANGAFTLTSGGRAGTMVGNAKVSIVKAAAVSKADPKPEDLAKMAVDGGYKQEDIPKPEIPVKYANPATSNLTASVDADASKNDFVFNLVD